MAARRLVLIAAALAAAGLAGPAEREAGRVVLPRGPIGLSLYSLPSTVFEAEAAEAFLAGVRAVAPRRTLVALVDPPMRGDLEGAAARLDVVLLDTASRRFSPWPRDPLTFVRAPGRGLGLLVRPNRQPLREEDAAMGEAFARGLPPAVAARWGPLSVATAPIPFHNGHILLTRDAAWVSLHTFEPRILEMLDRERVPVEEFATAVGIDRYLTAARGAAGELEALYGVPVRFVHPLPAAGALAERERTMALLGGGAGFDLDTLLTLLPDREGDRGTALVGDPERGADLIATVAPEELALLARGYGLVRERCGERLVDAQRSERARRLQGFLDLVAAELTATGWRVERLPLLLVPTPLLDDRSDLGHQTDFVIGWNNVVVEETADGRRAEGFASLLPAGDAAARRAYAGAGYALELLPPLVESVRRNGGYRCASNHVYPEG